MIDIYLCRDVIIKLCFKFFILGLYSLLKFEFYREGLIYFIYSFKCIVCVYIIIYIIIR